MSIIVAPNEEPDPAELLERLLCIISIKDLATFVRHAEDVHQYGYGEVKIAFQNFKPILISHQASDKAEIV